LAPKSAIQWLDQDIYPAITSFQKEVAFGGSEAALIFWFADHRRFDYRQAEQAAYWKCSGAHGKCYVGLYLRRNEPSCPAFRRGIS
jgi:hypothetical protein